jgi:hypothetical protein
MIDFDKYWSLILQFFSNNVFIAIGTGIVVLVFFYKKPVETIKFLAFCTFLVTVLYIMSLLTESGSQGVFQKKDMSTRSETELMK